MSFRFLKSISNNSNLINKRYENLNENDHNNDFNDKNTLEISYDNWYENKEYEEIKKMKYGEELRKQIEENELRKQLERKKKEEEDLKDELRIKKELEMLEEKRRKEELLLKQKIEEKKIEITIPKKEEKKEIVPETNLKINYDELIKSKQESIEKFNREMIDSLHKMSYEYNKNYDKINNELKRIQSEYYYSNKYNEDLERKIRDINQAIILKDYENNFKKYYYKNINDNDYTNNYFKNRNKSYIKKINKYYKIDKQPYFERKNKNYNYELPPIILTHSISYNVPKITPYKNYNWYY